MYRRVVSTIESDLGLEQFRLDSLLLATAGAFLTILGTTIQMAHWLHAPLLSAPLFTGGLMLTFIGFDRYRRWRWLSERYTIAPGIPVELAFKRRPGEPLDPGFFKLASLEESPEYIQGERIPDPGPVQTPMA